MKAKTLAMAIVVTLLSGQAQAVLTITNGDFQNAPGPALTEVPDWFDYDGEELAWWQQTSVDNAPGISPFPGDSAYLFLSGFDNEFATWAYQNVGTNSTGLDSVFVNFDFGELDDAPFPRNRTINFDIYESDGSFVGAQNVDIMGASGVTLVDSQSFTTGPLAAGETGFTNLELDLSSASTTNDLWLRVSASAADDTDQYTGIDNISLTEEPIIVPPVRLEVNRDTGDMKLVNDGDAFNLVQYTIATTDGNLVEANWAPIAENGDQDSGGSIDPDDTWEIVQRDVNNLQEQDVLFSGSDDGVNFAGEIPLGSGVWQKYYDESTLEVTLLSCEICDGSDDVTEGVPAFFVGNNVDGTDQPFLRSDFDFDNDLDADDFEVLLSNHLEAIDGELTDVESYALGDINGDQDNDVGDFRMFKEDFIAANGAEAFAALIAGSTAVPEPSSAALVLLGAAGVAVAARRRWVKVRAPVTLALVGIALCAGARQSHAVLSITNGDFENGADAFLTDVPDWFDYNGGEVAWWQQTSQDNTPAISPFEGDSSYLFLSGELDQSYWAYQGVGTNSEAKSSVFVNFDLGTLDDAGAAPLSRTITFDIFQSDGTFAGADDTDIVGAAGVTLVDSFSVTSGPLFAGETISLSGELDLSSASTTDELYLRVSNSRVGDTFHYTGLDNFTLSDAALNPLEAPAFQLEVNTTTGEIGLRNRTGAPLTLDHYEVQSEVGGLSSSGWESFSDQGIDAVDGPDEDSDAGSTLGEKWEVAGAVDPEQASTDLLAELFLLGGTTFADGEFKSLGAAYNTTVDDMNLTFSYSTEDGAVVNDIGVVVFDPVIETLLGDFNDDGVVNLADYTVWRDNLGADDSVLPPGTTDDGSGTVDAGDYETWKNNFGAVVAGAGALQATPVPEPVSAMQLACIAACGMLAVRFRPQAKHRRG